MITNFEEITRDLSPDEKKLIPIIVKSMEKYTKKNQVKTKTIIDGINANRQKLKIIKKMNGARLRKLINFIRSNGIQPIIGTSQGYFVSYEQTDIQDEIESMEQRSNSILKAANGMKVFFKQ